MAEDAQPTRRRKKKKRKRVPPSERGSWGRERQGEIPNRFTPRLDNALWGAIDHECERYDLTQRQFLERALLEEFDLPPEIPYGPVPDGWAKRNGMYIDPALIMQLDHRKDEEFTTQRAILERAVRRLLKRLDDKRREALEQTKTTVSPQG